MSSSNSKGFTLVELMIAMVIGALLVLAAMVLYVPVSRSLIDQGVIGQQTLGEALNYDFDVMNSGNAGYGITAPQVNTDLVLVNGSGPGANVAVPIPASGSAQGNGIFWDWDSPVGGATVSCAGLQVVKSSNPQSSNDRLVYFEEAPANGTSAGGSCTATAMNTAANWDVVTVLPSVATTNLTPIVVTAAQNCDLRGSQILLTNPSAPPTSPIFHPLVSLQLPVAQILTGGFFSHTADMAPVNVCMRNLP